MPAITRKFVVNDHLTFTIFEPSLTGDNLGFKTWSSSLLLSRRLEHLRKYIVGDCSQVLELGAGTGLVGMAAACIWNTHVLLTDLPEIVPNLQKNLEQNKGLLKKKASVDARSLDWRDENDVPNHDGEKYMVIVAADPIYSPEQPSILVSTVCRWLHPSSAARFVVGVPLRDRFDQERQSLKRYLQVHNFQTVAEGVDTGYDDWRDRDGQPMEVKCWWTVWQRYPPD
jgi:predicted nicotinamide N-methyase